MEIVSICDKCGYIEILFRTNVSLHCVVPAHRVEEEARVEQSVFQHVRSLVNQTRLKQKVEVEVMHEVLMVRCIIRLY